MATKTLEDYTILYKILEDTYKELTPLQKVWVDNNWKSMMERFAEELLESANDAVDSTWKECWDCGEEGSQGNYDPDDHWRCDDCYDPDEEESESEEEQEEHNLDEILARPVGAKKDSSAE